jgi:conjugative relaxase-like TrwC/TraI family protein
MLSLSTGHDTRYLTDAVAGGREGYYTGAVAAGEPPGRWYGAGIDDLGLRGQVDETVMEAVFSRLLDPRDPASRDRETWENAEQFARGHRAYRSAEQIYDGLLEAEPDAGPERRAELRTQAEQSTRQAVSFIDATFSAPKSVTVLAVAFERAANDARAAGDHEAAAAWETHQQAVEDAVMAAAKASVDYLQDVAGYSRAGHHGGGAGRWVDAHGFVVAQFLQHDSRDRDPQLHVHQAILNRVQCADGSWRTLDSRALHTYRAAAAAIAERVMEAHLARSLGVRFETRPDGRAREILGVPDSVMDLFSSRRRAITTRTEELVRAYRERHGREPSPLERTQISQRATLATRRAKSHDGETAEQRLDRWEAEIRGQLRTGLAEVGRMVLDRAQDGGPAATWSERDIVERALASLGDARASWSRSDLIRALSDALPGQLDIGPERVRELLDRLADVAEGHAVPVTAGESTEGFPEELLRDDGRSVYEQPGAARFSTPGNLRAERALHDAAVERGAPALSLDEAGAVVARFAESGRELGADQAAAVRGVLTSGAQLEVLCAAAGTGKSFVVGGLADAWSEHGHRVFGLAPSENAAQVLAEDGVTAANVDRWLGAQRRLDRPSQPDEDDARWRLCEGDMLVVDEAGMAATGQLLEVQQRCAAAGAKLLLVGDPAQLGAVGPGGALADVADRGLRYELTEVRRFSASWEGPASLRLRDRDPPALDAYQRHGRLRAGGTAEQAEAAAARAWLGDHLAGRESLLLVAGNETADRVGSALRAELVSLGLVDEQGVELAAHGQVAAVGDQVQARRNAWELIGHDGNTRAPLNRGTFQITEARPDGSLRVVDPAGIELTLPAGYVAADVSLAYASTVHAAEGRTVDTAHSVIAGGTDPAAAYVSLTRGRDANTAWMVTRSVGDDAPTGETLQHQPRAARAVLADVLAGGQDRAATEMSATALIEQEQERAASMQRHVDRLSEEAAAAIAGRTGRQLDELAAEGALDVRHRADLAADPAFGGLERLLRSVEVAGHDPAQVLDDAVRAGTLAGARSPAGVLHSRVTTALDGRLAPQLTSYADLIPAGLPEQQQARLQELADAADERRRDLGARTADQAPQWAIEALGSVPDDPMARADWEQRAGWAAAHRELAGHVDEADPLGAAPPAGLAENHASWRAAHDALGLSEYGAEEAEMSDGRLRNWIRAFEREQTWAPEWVGDELAEAEHAVQRHQTDATVWAARAGAAEDPAEAQRLGEDAALARTRAAAEEQRVAQLQEADTARSYWYMNTAVARDKCERGRAALAARGVDVDDPRERVTADEWLAEQQRGQVHEERHREVTEDDVRDDVADQGLLEATGRDDEPVLETEVPDIRDVSKAPASECEDRDLQEGPRSEDDTAALIARAQAALAEIADRQAADSVRTANDPDSDERREELTRWAADDAAREAERGDEAVLDR